MIVALLGPAGVGKTTIAEKLESIIPDSFIIDGDDLRVETSNVDIGFDGREKNMHLGYSRARWLSDLGFTVFIAMQAPFKEIRQKYLNENDIQVVINNIGINQKDQLGYNLNFEADYTDSDLEYDFEYFNFNVEDFQKKIFKRVLIIARFQGLHRGHKIIMEVAKRLSPDITIGLRVDEGDMLDLDNNIALLENMGYQVIKTPDLEESNQTWEEFVSDFDTVVQGNPDVISKFEGAIEDGRVSLKRVPRIGHISATKIRQAIEKGDDDFALKYVTPNVFNFLKQELVPND